MSSNLSDQEQMQLLKNWWKKYGSYFLIGLLLFLVSSYGSRYWRHYCYQQAESAAFSYNKMVNELNEGHKNEGLLLADHLMREYKKSIYTTLAALIKAQEMIISGKIEDAKKDLLWVVERGRGRGMRQLARIRLARLFIIEKKSDKAVDILAKVEDGSFTPAIFEVRGDALWDLGRKDDALADYKKALIFGEARNLQSPFLQLKLQRF